MQQSFKAKGYFALFITSFFWGTTWVASKMGVRELPALQLASIRQFIAGALFLSFFIFFKKLPLPTIKQFVWLFIMSIIMFVLANGLSTWAIQYIPAGLGALIGATYPLCVVIIERVFFKSKRLNTITFMGLFLGIAGIVFVFYENAFKSAGDHFWLGIFLSVIAVLSWSAGTIFVARNKVEINPYYGIGWQMMIAGIILFITAQLTQPVIPITQLSGKVWMIIAYLVVFGSIATFIAFIYSVKKLPAAIASLYAYINPLVAMVTAHFVLGDVLGINILWGSVFTLAGVFLVNYSMKETTGKPLTEPEI